MYQMWNYTQMTIVLVRTLTDVNSIDDQRKNKGPPGIEPGTSRSAVECSTPEL